MTEKKVVHISLDETLPPPPTFDSLVRRAPKRPLSLSKQGISLALKNALRYVPSTLHESLAPEFLDELLTRGRIYGYRYRPHGALKGMPIETYPGKCIEGKAFQVMIDNNLDFEVALYPYELVTYGETGQVCQNWMQYQLIKKYLSILTENQTLAIASGHPLGLFRSSPESPRVVLTNGLMVGMFDNEAGWQRATSLGVANYGQMTAGGWMYIGPQGIVHGTYNTLLIAARTKLQSPATNPLSGKLFVSSGLGGMSGAQAKAIEIARGVGIIAEVDKSRIETRKRQGWVSEVAASPKIAFEMAKRSLQEQRPLSIAYFGNIVDLLQYATKAKEKIDLLSDQTSCHAAYEGGYCPQGLSFEERTHLLASNRAAFISKVNETLKAHFHAIQALTEQGTYFFDYGNSFMKAVFDAGVTEISRNGEDESEGFIWPSYIEELIGPYLFDYGYGPFRWVCLSGREDDLKKTDKAARDCILSLRDPLRPQDVENATWVEEAEKNHLVVGTKARILYQDAKGRTAIAHQFNAMIRRGEIGPVMLGRDHHDTGGTDSPLRETANIKDGSNVMADMATLCFAGNAARGMSLVSLHNGGGVGIGKAINGGFGLVLDGSERVDRIIERALPWDVMVGVTRRAWAQNPNAIEACEEFLKDEPSESYTLPHLTDEELINTTLKRKGIA